jgi:hypothetical protein
MSNMDGDNKIPEVLPATVRAWLTQAPETLAPRLGGGRNEETTA